MCVSCVLCLYVCLCLCTKLDHSTGEWQAHYYCVGEEAGWTSSRHFPLVSSFLLPYLPSTFLYILALFIHSHPPRCPLLSSYHLLPLLFTQSQWIISHWPLLVIWSHVTLHAQLFPPFLSCLMKPYLYTHTQLQNYQCYIRMSLGLRFFLHSALGAVEDTGAPGPPLPADVGNRDTVGGARQRLAAAAGVRAGWICHLFFMNLRRNWGKKRANKSIFPGSHNFFMPDRGLFIIDSCNFFTLLLLSFVRFSN